MNLFYACEIILSHLHVFIHLLALICIIVVIPFDQSHAELVQIFPCFFRSQIADSLISHSYFGILQD